jgi:hypothetical protein
VERRDVEYVQLIGPDAALWAEESDPDMDEDGNLQSANAVTLPELPFTASTKVGKSLAKKIRDWMKESLSSKHMILLTLFLTLLFSRSNSWHQLLEA